MAPRNVISVTSAIRVSFITISYISRGRFLVVKCTQLVLSIFNDLHSPKHTSFLFLHFVGGRDI